MKKIDYSLLSIISFIISIIILMINLVTRANNGILTFIGLIFCIIGVVSLNYSERNKTKRGFKIVSTEKRKNKYARIPTRATKHSAAYDFYSPDDYTVQPNEIVKIWTDIKAYMLKDEILILNVRSSMGGKFMLANTQGWVDSDYYNNPDNEGNCGIFLKNISNETQTIKQGDRIAQGMFTKYLTCDNERVLNKERQGGFGSSGR